MSTMKSPPTVDTQNRLVIDLPKGCSLPCSAVAASRKSLSFARSLGKESTSFLALLVFGFIGSTSVTIGFPSVKVPVLSKITAVILLAVSKATPPLIRIPF